MPVRLKFKREKSVPSEYTLGFQDRPSHGLAVEAYDWMVRENIPRPSWPVSALVGLFITGYQNRFKRKISTLGSSFFVEVVTNLATLVIRVGMGDAADATEAVFSEHLRWVTSSHHKFLLNESNYARFIVPAMDKIAMSRRPRGEQAEFTGDRANGDVSVEEIDL